MTLAGSVSWLSAGRPHRREREITRHKLYLFSKQ